MRSNCKIDNLKPLKDKIDELDNTVKEMSVSLSFLSDKYDDLYQKVKQLEEQNKEIVEESTRLKQEIIILSQNVATKKDIVDNLHQYSRRDCLKITGIPEFPQENTDKIIKDLGSIIGVNIRDDISVSHCLPVSNSGKKNTNPAIIVKFVRRHVRDAFYNAKKILNGKSTKNLGFHRTRERKIYISESLTQKNKHIFKRRYKAKMGLNFCFIWTRHGMIFLRVDQNSPVISINNGKDIESLYRWINGIHE